MTMINYSPTSYVFTSSLPTEIAITTDASSVEVSIECNGNSVFTTTLYPYNKQAVLYDIRSIIEGYLLANSLTTTKFTIFADDGEGLVNTHEVDAIYCRVDIPLNDAAYYIQTFFFNTLSAYVIPYDAMQQLTYFTISSYALTAYFECLVLLDGSDTPTLMRTEEKQLPSSTSQLKLHTIYVYPSRIMEQFGIAGKLLSFTAHYGFLAKTFYVTYNTQYITLAAANEFGCPEYIHLTCVTKRKLDLSRSTATCLGSSTFYDDNTAYEYEVESAMLTIEEANHIAILLLSHDIRLCQGQTETPILITEISNEISDAANATNSIKFKYKFSRPQLPISPKFPQNIFDDPFHRTFD